MAVKYYCWCLGEGKFDDGYEAYREWVLARMIEKGVRQEAGKYGESMGTAKLYVVGSLNLDPRALKHNTEIGVIFKVPAIAEEMAEAKA